jgi:hypothetical protein
MKKLVTYIVIIFTICSLSACMPSSQSATKMGNSNANIVNGGMSIIDGDWIYFANVADQNQLYRIKTDGTQESKVSEDIAFNLNLHDGWFYYVNGSDSNRVYKMKSDGSGRQLLNEAGARNLIAYNDWLYFIDVTDPSDTVNYMRIFKIMIDGSEKTMINSIPVQYFNLDESWIFFMTQDEGHLYKVRSNGSGEKQVSTVAMDLFQISGNSIYYVDRENRNLWKMSQDGKNAIQLSDKRVVSFNAGSEWIYYSYSVNESVNEFGKMKNDGSEPVKINDDSPLGISVVDDWLFYLNMETENFTFTEVLMKTDGSNRKEFKPVNELPVIDRYQVEDEVEVDGLSVKVLNAYATNLLENKELGLDTQLYDSVETTCCIFVRFIATNKSDTSINLQKRLGLYKVEEDGTQYSFWAGYADVENIEGKDALDFYLNKEDYNESLILAAGQQKEIQLIFWTLDKGKMINFGIHLPDQTPPMAIIEVSPMQKFVCTYDEARQKIIDKFGSGIREFSGVVYKFPGEKKEMLYYTFATGTAGSSDEKFYLVKMETGIIYSGKYSDKYPDYKAIPIEPVD